MNEIPLIEIARFRNNLSFEIDVPNDRVIVKHGNDFATIEGDLIANFFIPSQVSKALDKVANQIDPVTKPNLTQFKIDFEQSL